jgi:curli biogenesis system outer membrane secretion channel CsgG
MKTRCHVSRFPIWLVAVVSLAFPGCTLFEKKSAPEGAIPYKKGKSATAVVAVMDLENRTGAHGQWNLGSGFADMLVTRLMESKKVTVLERQYLNDVLSELSLQQQAAFRAEGKVPTGRLKNAKFLIRGAVTEFDDVGGLSGGVGYSSSGSLGVHAGAKRAVVGLHLRVYDVESGEILSSVKAQGNVKSGGAGVSGQYKGVHFGGEAFMRTPLGKASEKAISQAVPQLLKALPVDYWHPLVADVQNELVLVNGGQNVGLKPGDQFFVREKPRQVTDPATGDVIETVPGRQVGRISILKVSELSSTAALMEGTAERGKPLTAVPKAPK